MQANDAVVIIRTVRPKTQTMSFRVAYIENLDELEFFEKKDPANIGAYLLYKFAQSPRFANEQKALQYAADVDSHAKSLFGLVKKYYKFVYFSDYIKSAQTEEELNLNE